MARLTAEQRLLRSVTERDVQEALRQFADVTGALYFHDEDARRNMAGWPDTALVLPERRTLWLLENKTETGRLRPMQAVWGNALTDCTRVMYGVVRPSTLGFWLKSMLEEN